MTILTGQFPQNTYGDLLTTINGGQGLSNTLQPLQDGLGNSSSIQLAQGMTQFNNIMAIPVWATAARPAAPLAGTMGFNTTTASLEIWSGTAWVTFLTSSASRFLAAAWGYINPDGSLAGSAGVSSTALQANTYTVTLGRQLANENYSIVHGLSFTGNVVRMFNVVTQTRPNFTFRIVDGAGNPQTDTYTYFAVFGSP